MNELDKVWIIMCIGLLFCIIGLRLQFDVMRANNGDMLLINSSITQNLILEQGLSEDYIIFNNKLEVNKSFLGDIFPFFNYGYFSLGDLFIFSGLMISITSFILRIKLFKLKRGEKK
jgi:hypothetical protein